MKDTIIVTGGTKGIGRAIINLFVDKGFEVVTCARSKADLELLRERIALEHNGARIHVMDCDLSQKKEIDSFVSYCQSHAANLKILVNNAGMFIPGQIHSEPEGTYEKIMATNVTSVYHISRGLINNLIANQGHLFNICSTASIVPYVNGGSYCISKYALLAMTRILREEMKDKHVRVTAVLPGATYTSSWEGTGHSEDRFIKPADVAHAIWASYAVSPQTVIEELLIRPQLGDIE